MFETWIELLLEENNITDTSQLTNEMIEEAIQDERDTIDNEECWIDGSTGETRAMHKGNVVMHEEFIEYLEGLKTEALV